ncbi:MAG: MFS transporter [Verrucomicrobia bacterium]|nr:MFS transporter [Verrucomicrobiota bacterium]
MSVRSKWGPLDTVSALAFINYAASATITPICLVILAKEMGFSLSAAGALEALRNIVLVAVLLISAFLAGAWGKVRCLGYGALVIGLGFLLYAFAPSLWLVAFALVLLGCGGGVQEALISPLVHELHPEDSGRFLNLVNAFWSIGVLMTMLVAGELLTRGVSWRWIIGSLGLFSTVIGILYLTLRHAQPRAPRINIGQVMRSKWQLVRMRHFWVFLALMMVAGGIEGAFTFWSATYVQLELGGNPRQGGIAAGSLAFGMIAGRLICGIWIRQDQLRALLRFAAMGGLVFAALLPFVNQFWLACIVFLCIGFCVAPFWPTIQAYAVDRLKVDATVLFILLSCGANPGYATITWLVGWIGDSFDLRWGFWILAPLFVVLLAGLILEGKIRVCPEVKVS